MENVPTRTLTENPVAEWLVSAGTFMGRIWSAVRAFRGALHKEPVRASDQSHPVAALPRPSQWVESGELPETYGRTKVVAMVVSPYMIYVYWDLSPKDQARVGPALLRFHDAADGGSFDVKIDLHAGNWYVNLWSPEKRYSIELGRQAAGVFVSLGRSNLIETPRAWPVAAISQPEPPSTGVAGAPNQSVPVSPASPIPAAASVTAAIPVPAAPPAPATVLAQPAVVAQPEAPVPPPALPPNPPNALETLRRRLSELYGFRRWPQAVAVPEGSAPEESLSALPEFTPTEASPDFTSRVETQFAPGLSSVLLGVHGRNQPPG